MALVCRGCYAELKAEHYPKMPSGKPKCTCGENDFFFRGNDPDFWDPNKEDVDFLRSMKIDYR